MKSQVMFMIVGTLLSLTVLAQEKGNGDIGSAGSSSSTNTSVSGQVSVVDSGLRLRVLVAGKGNYVCSSENSFQNVPYLARGQSRREAEILAVQECKKNSTKDAFFCKVIQCEQDRTGGNKLSVLFNIERSENAVSIKYDGKVKYACYADGWRSEYVAKAATKTEAMALAKGICAEDEGVRQGTEPKGFFCKTDRHECEQIEGVRARIDLGDLIRRIK